MYVTETRCEDMDGFMWLMTATGWWWSPVNMVMNVQFHKGRKFLD
jgi:hypothetical protein